MSDARSSIPWIAAFRLPFFLLALAAERRARTSVRWLVPTLGWSTLLRREEVLAVFEQHDVSKRELLFAYFKMLGDWVGLKVEVVGGHSLNFLVELKNGTAEFP